MMSRPRVLVTNWESSDNLGDHAILAAQVAFLEDTVGACVRLLGNQPGVSFPSDLAKRHCADSPWPSPWRHGTVAWVRGLLLAAVSLISPAAASCVSSAHAAVVRTISTADVVMPKGGGYFLADGSPRRCLFLLRMLYPLLLARRLGVARVLWGHSIGPVHGRPARALMRMALGGAEIVVRDEASVDVCRALGLHAGRAPDFALLSGADARPSRRTTPVTAQVHVGVTAKRVSANPRVQAGYIDAMSSALTLLAESAAHEATRAVFHLVPQVIGPTPQEDDRPVLAELAKKLPSLPLLHEERPETIAAAVALYGEFDFVLATRLHSAILAACAGTPFAVYGYVGGKARGFVQDVGLPSWVTTSELEQIPRMTLRCFEARRELRVRLESGLDHARARLEQLRLSVGEQSTAWSTADGAGVC